MKSKRFLVYLLAVCSFTNFAAPSVSAEDGPAGEGVSRKMHREVTVTATQDQQGPFLPAYSGAQIYAGKKTSSHSLDNIPSVQPDQYRRAFSSIPGLLVSEVATPSIVNLSYRGLNDPHESNGMLIMKDGIPVLSDWHGYPTLYYSPPLEAVERVEFIRGGSSLLYGPQPGPVLNYVTHSPSKRPFEVETKHTFGGDGLYSLFNSVSGTTGPAGYYGYYHHRQADGQRINSDYSVHSGNFKAVLQATDTSRLTANFDAYESESGESGRLTYAQYSDDPNRTTTRFDRLWINRYAGSLTLEQEIAESGLLTLKPWVGTMDRFSRRQTGATTLTNLDRQEFTFVGLDNRMRWIWELFGEEQILTGGFLFYYSDAPRNRELGVAREERGGAEIFDLDRHTQYWSIFLEELFKFWRVSIVPSFRLEMMEMRVEEKVNTGVTRDLENQDFSSAVPLFGIGTGFDLGKQNELYTNVSQGYQPREYDDLVNPTSNTFRPPSDLQESRIWNYEVGVRGKPVKWISYDTSLFYIDYDNYIENLSLGGANFQRSNSGHAQFGGWEAMTEVDLVGMTDQMRGTETGKKIGEFGPFGNIQLLDAKFTGGANDGKTPAYAPEYIVKWGLTHKMANRFRATLSSVFVADHYWQDSNAAGTVGTTKVGTYKVWDLALECNVYKDIVSIFGGASNLFDETYYSRVRSDGIEPADGRNIYGGFKVKIGVG